MEALSNIASVILHPIEFWKMPNSKKLTVKKIALEGIVIFTIGFIASLVQAHYLGAGADPEKMTRISTAIGIPEQYVLHIVLFVGMAFFYGLTYVKAFILQSTCTFYKANIHYPQALHTIMYGSVPSIILPMLPNTLLVLWAFVLEVYAIRAFTAVKSGKAAGIIVTAGIGILILQMIALFAIMSTITTFVQLLV